jgi:Phosphopantothenate-cysteine ligase (EC 6.3.2.5)/Phosphopantothenoylcysteine decarboxylase (EC 4.1.1.36)
MNTQMYKNPILQNNISRLRELGYEFINPGEGRLACGDEGTGKMAEPLQIIEYLKSFFY